MASDVPDALIRAAERLFAGARVRGRQPAGDQLRPPAPPTPVPCSTTSADRRGLLRAVLAKHEVDIEQRRHALLDAYEALPAPDVRALAAALVEPLAAELDNDDGGLGYLQLVSDLYNRPNPTFEPGPTPTTGASFARWRALAIPLLTPEAVRLHRRFDALRFTVVRAGPPWPHRPQGPPPVHQPADRPRRRAVAGAGVGRDTSPLPRLVSMHSH